MGNQFKGRAEHSAEYFGDTRDDWNWSEADTRRFFLAGGGVGRDFDAHFARAMASREAVVRGMDDGTYHGILGGAFYLVAGRKNA